MPVEQKERQPDPSTKHPAVERQSATWRKVRDAVEGEEAVKAGESTYLPLLQGQSAKEYEAYIGRASFYGASGRTVKGLSGAVFRKPYHIEFPGFDPDEPNDDDLLANLGGAGEPLESVVRKALEEVIGPGRVGLLVDADFATPNKPYVTQYYPENIINWKEAVVDGRRQPVKVCLYEEVSVDGADEFTSVCEERVRVYDLRNYETPNQAPGNPEGTTGRFVEVRLFRKVEGADSNQQKRVEWELVEGYPIVLKIPGGKLIDFIPFKFINPSSTNAEVEKPPIIDLVNVNLSHYRNSADIEHGLHFTALPQPWVAGFVLDTGGSLAIGSSKAWVTDNENAKAGYLEFSGTGLGAIREQMAEKKLQMAVLGARLLEEQKKDAEAAETVRLRQSGEKSVLSAIARSVSEGIEQVLVWVARWAGLNDKAIDFNLNQDFGMDELDGPRLTALMSMQQGGTLSFDAFFYNLQRAEMYPDGHTLEKERDLIAAGGPTPPPGQVQQDAAQLDVQSKELGLETQQIANDRLKKTPIPKVNNKPKGGGK